MSVSGIKGDKDIEINAGDLNMSVGNSSDWGYVDASVTAGDIHAPAFKEATGGLFSIIPLDRAREVQAACASDGGRREFEELNRKESTCLRLAKFRLRVRDAAKRVLLHW
jgi:hypothetical protein